MSDTLAIFLFVFVFFMAGFVVSTMVVTRHIHVKKEHFDTAISLCENNEGLQKIVMGSDKNYFNVVCNNNANFEQQKTK